MWRQSFLTSWKFLGLLALIFFLYSILTQDSWGYDWAGIAVVLAIFDLLYKKYKAGKNKS